jgi:hypothetical protein
MLLDGLAPAETVSVSAALRLTPLAQARRVTSGDALVIVTRRPWAVYGGCTLNAWLRAERAVYVISPADVPGFRLSRAIPLNRAPAPVATEPPRPRYPHRKRMR